MNKKYYFALIDLCKKTVQLRECNTCQAVDMEAVCTEHGMERSDFATRFRYCFIGNDKTNYMDKIYKYARKFKEV